MADDLIDSATFNDLREAVGADFVTELLDTFFEEGPGMIAELRDAFAAEDAEGFRRAAHSLKTNAFTFGAAALGARAKALEQGGVPADGAGIDALEAMYRESAAALQALKNG